MAHLPFAPESPALLDARGKRLLDALDRVLERVSGDHDSVQERQTSELKALLEHAFENVPFYRKKYAAAGFHPSHFRTLNDIQRIPLVTKSELRNHDLGERSATVGDDETRILQSSGSSGVPLKITKSDDSLWYFTASNMLLYFDWCNGKPIDRVLYFLDLSPGAIDGALADLLRTTVLEDRIVAISEPLDMLLQKLFDYRPEFVSSYPSTLRLIAVEILRRGTLCASVKLLHLTSEMLDGGTRKLLCRAFPNARLVETYTSTEAGLMAYPCRFGDRLHFAEDAAIFEIVDDAGSATDDIGEIVVTDLTSCAAPLIRYRGLGDYCKWNPAPCGCGSPFRSIDHLEGRCVDSIILRDNTGISPYCAGNALEEIDGIWQFQIIQCKAGEALILVVKDRQKPLAENAIQAAIHSAIHAATKALLKCEIRFVETIPQGRGRHKVPLVISEILRPE